MSFHFRLIAASLLMVSLGSNAAVTISIQQSGSDVIAAASGSLALPSCLATSSGSSLGIIYWAASDDYSYTVGQGTGTQCITSFATAQPLNAIATDQLASSNTGGPIGVNRLPSGGNILTVPNGYTSGSSISSTSTWTGRTLASLNLVPGTYTFDFGTDTITYVVGTLADLSITKTDGVATATPGGTVTYTVTASNAGPSNVTGATVGDSFPLSLTCNWTCAGAGGGSCTASGSGNINDSVSLPSGGSVIYTASCAIAASATGSLSNTATITAPGGVTDPTPANNTATDSDTLTPQADLSITKTDGVTSATPGGSVTYTIIASNAGPSNVTGATVGDSFPPSLTCSWTCAGAGGGSCTASGSGNINDSVNLPSGGSVIYTASCAIAASATGTLSNTATITAPGGVTDPTPANNTATDSDTLTAASSVNPVPVFSPWALGLLVLLLAVVATRQQHLRRSQS